MRKRCSSRCARAGATRGADDRKFLEALHYFALHNVDLARPAGRVRPLELGVEAVLAVAPGRRLRGVLRDAGKPERHGPSHPDVRFHRGAGPCLSGRGQRGQSAQALGRSRGGFSTKIHLKTDFDGRPIAFHLTGGEAGDGPVFPLLFDIGPDVKPRAAVADKGYDSKANRAAARERGICPAIPHKVNAKKRPAFFPKTIYRGRARIEQTFGKLKRFKRVALRCEKTTESFDAIVALACSFILIKSVHTA